MHHDVGFCHEFVHELGIADVASDKRDFVEHAGEVLGVPGVRQLVDHGNFILRSVLEGVVNEVRPDEPRTTRNEYLSHRCIIPRWSAGRLL